MMTVPTHMLTLALVFLTCGIPVRAAAEGRFNTHRIRVLDDLIKPVIAEGVRWSPSLRAMIDRLSRSDVIVYVACGTLPPGIAGHLTWVGAAGGARYVSVRVTCEGPDDAQVGILGHELQHAIEIADRPDIVDEASLIRAYDDFGVRRPSAEGLVSFDSDDAYRAGRRIRREVALRTD